MNTQTGTPSALHKSWVTVHWPQPPSASPTESHLCWICAAVWRVLWSNVTWGHTVPVLESGVVVVVGPHLLVDEYTWTLVPPCPLALKQVFPKQWVVKEEVESVQRCSNFLLRDSKATGSKPGNLTAKTHFTWWVCAQAQRAARDYVTPSPVSSWDTS